MWSEAEARAEVVEPVVHGQVADVGTPPQIGWKGSSLRSAETSMGVARRTHVAAAGFREIDVGVILGF